MRMKELKVKVDRLYRAHYKEILCEFFLVGYVNLLAQYLRDGFFSFFVSLFLFPMSHGYVKHCMNLVDSKNPKLHYKDSLVGILEFPRVAPVYLAKRVLLLAVTSLCALPFFIMVHHTIASFSWELLGEFGNVLLQSDFLVPHLREVALIFHDVRILINIVFCIFIYSFLNGLLMCVPYIIEQDDYSWNEAFLLSVKMMRGHMLDYFKICYSYLGRYLAYWLLTGVLLLVMGSIHELLLLLSMVCSLFLYIGLFRARFELMKYMFYKTIKEEKRL